MGRGVREVNHRRQVLTTGPPCLAQEIRFPKMVTSCCRFLCYFCRISRQNQRSMFDHLSYLLENSSIGLGENPQTRAAPQSPLLAIHQARPTLHVSLTHSFSKHSLPCNGSAGDTQTALGLALMGLTVQRGRQTHPRQQQPRVIRPGTKKHKLE